MIRKTDTTITTAPIIEQMTMAAISPPLNEDEDAFSAFLVVSSFVDEEVVTEPLLVVTVVSETITVIVVPGRPVVTISDVSVDVTV